VWGFLRGLAVFVLAVPAAAQTPDTLSVADPLAPLPAESALTESDPGLDSEPSPGVQQVTTWVLESGDAGGLPFIVVDKSRAEVFLFDASGQFMGRTAALIGITEGDNSVPGVGDRELAKIPLEERTTPAGRFVAKLGPAYGKKVVLWIDYTTALSLHPVVTGSRDEKRLERLKSPSPDDNRITFGCINVPRDFFKNAVLPLFKTSFGIVYILPETKTLTEAFNMPPQNASSVRANR
jgi:hypothetical protein